MPMAVLGRGDQIHGKPWKYSERLAVANAVDMFKKKVEKQDIKPATKHSILLHLFLRNIVGKSLRL